MSLNLLNINSNSNKWERIWLLAKIEFKLRYYENKLGLLWALLKPLFMLFIYYFAFKIIMRNNIPNFAIYLFNGLIIWEFFLESTGGLILILRTKRYLYEYSNMSKIEIYLASLISTSLGFIFNLIILIIALLFSGVNIDFHILFFPLIFIELFAISIGGALILSNLYLIFRDINQIWPLISNLFMWISPIFFSAESLQQNIPFLKYINPMFGIIVNSRNVIMNHSLPDFNLFYLNLLQTIIILTIGLLLLKKLGVNASEKL